MISIDSVAYMSKLKKMEPRQKLAFALVTLGTCIWADYVIVSVAVIFIMGFTTVCRGGVPLRTFLRLFTVPMSFLLLSVITIAVNVSELPELLLISIPLSGKWIGVTRHGLHEAAGLFLKALGAVSCLYFLSLNTPMVDVLAALRKLKAPKLLVELMGLVYRFIFVLLETSNTIITAQNARLGYTRLSTGYHALGMLASSLFIRTYKRSDELYTALESRGYDGELNVLEEPYDSSLTGCAAAAAVNTVLILASIYLK